MGYSVPSLADGVDDALLRTVGEFQIGNGDTKIIADQSVPEPYRVCVAKGPDVVPVKASYDGQERTINVGDCATLTAKVIRLSAAGKLKEDEVLIGKYEHLKK
jgi:hypothetical protein